MTPPSTSPEARLAAVCATRALATVAATALAFRALAAACAPEGDAAGGAPRTPLPDDDVERVLRAAGATTTAHPVWVVNAAWVDGDPGAEPLVRDGRWVAGVGGPGSGSGSGGTLVAHQSAGGAGRLTVTARDDDAGLGDALAGLGPQDTLVAHGDGWLVVTADRVRPLAVAAAGRPHGASATRAEGRPDGPDGPGGLPADELTMGQLRDVLALRG